MDSEGVGRRYAALAGLLAVGVTLGVAELAAAVAPGSRSLVVAVGDVVIDLVPGWLERAVISTLGGNDKPFLLANIMVVSGLLGAVLGILSVRRFVVGAAGLATMTGVGVAASIADPQTDVAGPIAAGAAAVSAGILALWLLLRAVRPSVASAAAPASADGCRAQRGQRAPHDPGRRRVDRLRSLHRASLQSRN